MAPRIEKSDFLCGIYFFGPRPAADREDQKPNLARTKAKVVRCCYFGWVVYALCEFYMAIWSSCLYEPAKCDLICLVDLAGGH